jgi:hypothetical protein
MPHPTNRSWRADEIAKLIELADSGATAVRAASALGRRITVVQKKARQLGKNLAGVRQVKARLRKAMADSSSDGFRS